MFRADRSVVIWVSLLLLMQQGNAIAQDSVRIDLLEEVTVRYRNALHARSITPSQTLKGKSLERMNSLSVADAVRYFSGVQLKDYGGIGGLKTIDTRSMGSNHTGVFYDGIQLGNAQNGQVDLGKFSLDNIEEITMYNAQKSEIFQPARSFANATSIYLQSKTPVFEGSRKSNVSATIRTGSFGLADPSVLWEQKISSRTNASISSEWICADGKYRFRYTNGTYDTIATRENADINAYRLEGGFSGTLTDSAQWKLKIYHYNSERGLPGAVVANKFVRGQRQWDNNFFIQSSYKSNPSKKYQYWINGKFAHDHLRYLDPEFITTDGALDNRYTQKELYLSAANYYSITEKWEAAASVDFQWNTLDANLYHFPYPTRYQLLASVSSQLNLPGLNIQAGTLQTLVQDKVKQYESSGNKSELSPFISASWQPFETASFKLRGFYKNIFRLPTFNDLYYTFIGNTNLRPEYTTQYDIGFSWIKQFPAVFKYLSIQTDAYYNTITDKIVAVPTTNLYRWMMLNLGKVDVKGLDLGIEGVFDFDKAILNTTLKYTYQQALDVTNGAANYKHQIPYVPRNSGSVIFNLTWNRFDINYSFIYSGYRYSQKMNIPVNYVQPWYTHDISISKQISLRRSSLKLLLEMNNVFNQHYDVVINFPMPGRYFRASLNIRI